MKTTHITDYRSQHNILISPMTEKELKDNMNKSGRISTKIIIDFSDLLNNDVEWLNDEVSKRITDLVGGLVDITYSVAGRTTTNQIILKIDAEIDFEDY